ncbi:Putative major facilitator, sugar transporter, major facilitator superfamily [Septoria linicola]|uniref:Major facilitator, sugar transporter, major facilitator superfamily n=1 Tax=Septoria linicola TaxID=215465 RepID=A0A9Q9AEC8_9PEZI|nr:putative major facilitator, sugar transporter, major facilitator superfamily [Septoria linicola]USW47437.1 Putative major facilitator, sugar transporter, major facilitator superfamily [Septoria linicola]
MALYSELSLYFVYVLLTATLGPLLFGYHLAELNAPQDVITCVKDHGGISAMERIKHAFTNTETSTASTPLPQCIPMNPTQFGLVSSFFTLGGLIGALSAGPVTATHGRLKTMIWLSAFAVVGPVFEAAAPNIAVMAFGRLVAGIGAGGATVVVPIYISEISPPSKRGFFGAFTQILTNCGILITQALGLFMSKGQLWRVILGIGGVIALVQMVGLLLGGQESPKYLADIGKASQAKAVLRRLRSPEADIEEEIAAIGGTDERHEDDEQVTLLANEESGQSGARTTKQTLGFFGVSKHADTRPAVIAVIAIMVAQQFTGINSIVMYGVGLLSDLLAANSAILNVVVAAVNIVITTSCAPLADKWGRKRTLLLSITGMGLNSVLLAIGMMHTIKVLSAVAVILFVASFGLGLGPIPFILASELVSSEDVGAVQSWALAANWIATFVVAQFFPLVNDSMGKGQVYFIFAAFALAFGLFISWYVPETKGKQDADEVWGRRKAVNLED